MMRHPHAHIPRWGLLVLSLLACQFALGQGLKSEDYTSTNAMELRVEANVTKHFKVRNQSINVHLAQTVFSRLYESAYSQLSDATTSAQPYFRRSFTSLGVSYAPVPYLRIGAEYTLKVFGNKLKTADGTANTPSEYLRHRASFSLTGQYTYQNWKFSLRERLDANIRTDSVNLHEKPQTDLLLRHKIQAQYTIPGKPLKVYTYVELCNTLNQPVKYLNTFAGVDKDGNETAYAGKTFGQYLRLTRVQAGLRWRVDRCNTLGLAYRFTYGYSRDINIIKNNAAKKYPGYIELTHAKSFGHYIVVTYDLDW